MSGNRLIRDFTTGSIPRQLTRFMLPFMASNALQVLYSLVDMVIVGRFVGSAGLSGVSQGGMVMNFAAMLSLGFCNSGQIIVSQLIGAGRREELRRIIGTMFSVLAVFGLVGTVALLGLRVQVVDLLNVPPEARDMAITYVGICAFGLIFTCGYNVVASTLRGMGDSRHPFLFITIASALNVGLDMLFTGILGWGVAGAAWATTISQAASFTISILFLARHKEGFYFDFRPESFHICREYFFKMVRLGVPLALQACAINISMMLVNVFVNQIGVAASATFGVGVKIDDISNKLTLGVQYAAAPMVGQNVGAGKPERVRSVVYWTWLLSALVSAIFVAAYLLFGREIFGLFTDDPAVLELAPIFISAVLWSFPAMAVMRGTSSFLQGTGSALIIMTLAFVDSGLRVVLSYLMGVVLDLGFYGFTLGFALPPYGVAIPGAILFFFGKWRQKKPLVEVGGEKAPPPEAGI